MTGRQRAPLKVRRSRLLVRRAHVAPEQAAQFNAGVALDVHVGTGLRRNGDVHASAISVKFDAVVSTANAIFLIAAEVQRHAAVRTKLADQARTTFCIAKSQQFLAKNLNADLRAIWLGNLIGRQDRHPIASHQVTHGCSGCGAGQRLRHFLVHAWSLLGGLNPDNLMSVR